ncbi:nuclear body protein SP140-like isoform X2 [Rousettus aegyptiacus]|uniref:nuclear body protein SP140-like isoform X2 n=1 Tax=Rousettus aegyptiacus TaxID=9407 RepID=UPI00168D0D0B|nr:nuclear body protein SP140-like isoform X2 [Rousettus aegyptiacus]
MADGGRELDHRMFSKDWNPEEQNPEGQFYYESIFRLFKESKVEIASAITNTFPILMGLRDRGFISEQSYQHFLEACRNLVPVERVMYDVLSEIEKTFDKTFLKALFSRVNLKAYPDLHEIYRDFQNVLPENFDYPITDDKNRNYSLDSQLSCEQGDTLPRERILEHLSDGQQMSIREEESSHDRNSTIETQEMTNECAQETEQAVCREHSPFQINNVRGLEERPNLLPQNGQEDSSGFWESRDGEETQEFLYSPPSLEPVLCDPEIPQMITEKEREEVASPALRDREVSGGVEALQMDREGELEELPSSLPPCDGQVSGGIEALQMDREGESEELPSSLPPSDGQGTERSIGVNEEYSHVMSFSKDMPEGTKTRTTRSRTRDTTETVALANNSTLRKLKRKRGSRKLIDESVDFHSEILPVTCGGLKGMLYKNKLKQGSTMKCIQGEDGSWFTPQEFGANGVPSGWKNWKSCVYCGGRCIRWLIKEGLLPNPPIIYGKRKKLRNSNVCEVCYSGQMLFCCDTCSRSFHKNCHLPPVETERDPWSCIFCRMKAYSASQKCHRESEVLAKQMGPEEQLKCEFLLVKVYCHSESTFFKDKPYYYRINEISQQLKEPMWLGKIKKKLNQQGYPRVEGFVRDVRLIFQNHRASKKVSVSSCSHFLFFFFFFFPLCHSLFLALGIFSFSHRLTRLHKQGFRKRMTFELRI